MNTINNQTAAIKQPTNKELTHAFKVVKEQIESKRREMASATGEAREKLEVEIKTLIASIGLDVSQLEIEPEATATGAAENGHDGVGAKILVGMANLTAEAAKLTGDAAESLAKSIPTEEPGLWARFKAWVSENKKKAIAGALTIFAGAAGLWFWLRGKNINTAVSSVSGVTDGADPAPQIPTEEATASIFTRIGAWLVDAGVTVKGWAVSAWTWIKGLFNRNTTVTEATGEATPEAVPAGA